MEYDDGPVVEEIWKEGILETDSSEEGDAAAAVLPQSRRMSEPGNLGADDLHRENGGAEGIHRDSSGDSEDAAELGRRGSGREADYLTRGVPIDEVPVQETLLQSLQGFDEEIEGRMSQKVERRMSKSDATILDMSRSRKAAARETEWQRIRRRKWCLFFTAFTIACLSGAGVIIWYLKQHSTASSDTPTVAVQTIAADETGPPWDPDAPCAEFVIKVATDGYGNQTSWELFFSEEGDETAFVAANTGVLQIERKRLRHHGSDRGWGQTDGRRRATRTMPVLVLSRGPFPYLDRADPTHIEGVTGQYTSSICLPAGHYTFVVHDTGGDGLCCSYGLGGYSLYLENVREVYTGDGQFGSEEATEFVVTENDVLTGARTDSPSMSLMPTPAPLTPRVIPEGVQSLSTVSRDVLMAGSITSYGILFDVASSNASSLTILGMDLLLEATGPVEYEIWSKPGSWRDVSGTDYMEGFELSSNGTMNGTGLSEQSIVPLNDFRDVTIEGGSKQAFYVTLKESSLLVQNYDKRFGESRDGSGGFDVTFSSSQGVDVVYGSAVLRYPLEGVDPFMDLLDYKGFLGRLIYKVAESEPLSGVSIGTTLPSASSEPETVDTGNLAATETIITTTFATSGASSLTTTPASQLGSASSLAPGLAISETVSTVSPILANDAATTTVSSTSSSATSSLASTNEMVIAGLPVDATTVDRPTEGAIDIVGDDREDEGDLTLDDTTPKRIPRDAVNFALYGMASQSSTCFDATADRAIDGGRSPYMGADSIAHTCAEDSPWWQVDLGRMQEVGHVVILNRWNECCREKLNDAEVQILKSSGKVVAARPIVNGLKEFHVSFDPPVKGRTVRVQKNVFGDLSLAEVQVYREVYDIPNEMPDHTNTTVVASTITPSA